MEKTNKARYNTTDANKYIGQTIENVKTDEIIITRDKLENVLLKHMEQSILT